MLWMKGFGMMFDFQESGVCSGAQKRCVRPEENFESRGGEGVPT